MRLGFGFDLRARRAQRVFAAAFGAAAADDGAAVAAGAERQAPGLHDAEGGAGAGEHEREEAEGPARRFVEVAQAGRQRAVQVARSGRVTQRLPEERRRQPDVRERQEAVAGRLRLVALDQLEVERVRAAERVGRLGVLEALRVDLGGVEECCCVRGIGSVAVFVRFERFRRAALHREDVAEVVECARVVRPELERAAVGLLGDHEVTTAARHPGEAELHERVVGVLLGDLREPGLALWRPAGVLEGRHAVVGAGLLVHRESETLEHAQRERRREREGGERDEERAFPDAGDRPEQAEHRDRGQREAVAREEGQHEDGETPPACAGRGAEAAERFAHGVQQLVTAGPHDEDRGERQAGEERLEQQDEEVRGHGQLQAEILACVRECGAVLLQRLARIAHEHP